MSAVRDHAHGPGGSLEWVVTDERFASLQQEWDALAALTGVPFLQHAWFAAWWRAFGADRRLRICTLRGSGGELAAVFPLCAAGRRVEAMANAHTPLFRPFARDRDALRLVIEGALAAAPSQLFVPALPAGDPAVTLLLETAQADGRLALVEQRRPAGMAGARIDDDLRLDLERCREQLRARGAVFTVAEPPQALARELARCFTIERRCSSRRGARITTSLEAVTFYHVVALALARAGKLCVSTIEIGDRPIAVRFSVAEANRLWTLTSCYDQGYRSSLLTLLLAHDESERGFELRRDGAVHDFRCYSRRDPLPLADYGYRRLLQPRLQMS